MNHPSGFERSLGCDMIYFDIFVINLLVAMGLCLVGYGLAHLGLFSFMRPFFCNIMKWHSRNYEETGFDGCSVHAKCKWCGYEGLIDSQGNLF